MSEHHYQWNQGTSSPTQAGPTVTQTPVVFAHTDKPRSTDRETRRRSLDTAMQTYMPLQTCPPPLLQIRPSNDLCDTAKQQQHQSRSRRGSRSAETSPHRQVIHYQESVEEPAHMAVLETKTQSPTQWGQFVDRLTGKRHSIVADLDSATMSSIALPPSSPPERRQQRTPTQKLGPVDPSLAAINPYARPGAVLSPPEPARRKSVSDIECLLPSSRFCPSNETEQRPAEPTARVSAPCAPPQPPPQPQPQSQPQSRQQPPSQPVAPARLPPAIREIQREARPPVQSIISARREPEPPQTVRYLPEFAAPPIESARQAPPPIVEVPVVTECVPHVEPPQNPIAAPIQQAPPPIPVSNLAPIQEPPKPTVGLPADLLASIRQGTQLRPLNNSDAPQQAFQQRRDSFLCDIQRQNFTLKKVEPAAPQPRKSLGGLPDALEHVRRVMTDLRLDDEDDSYSWD